MTDLVERLRALPHVMGEARLCAEAADEIERLRVENWQLKGALGYPVPGHIMDNSDFKCGLCEAKTIDIIEATAEIERLKVGMVRQAGIMHRFGGRDGEGEDQGGH